MPTPETRTEHEARAAAAAAKARTALTPRSTSSGQAHYGELRQKSVKDASHSSMRCVIDCRTQRKRSGSHETRRWREVDSNHRSPVRERVISVSRTDGPA